MQYAERERVADQCKQCGVVRPLPFSPAVLLVRWHGTNGTSGTRPVKGQVPRTWYVRRAMCEMLRGRGGKMLHFSPCRPLLLLDKRSAIFHTAFSLASSASIYSVFLWIS